jgi:hypothetical protein
MEAYQNLSKTGANTIFHGFLDLRARIAVLKKYSCKNKQKIPFGEATFKA